jgi:diguanylate cyclase (GGDEF)-like protein/PAS domain S-box-containing protein
MATDLLKRPLGTHLPRSLSATETWGFGLTGHVGWIGTAPIIHAALGPKAIFVWLPGVLVSVALNLQVKHLGMCWPNMAGGTPNYAARLLSKYPLLAKYVAIGYFLGWVAAPAVYAIVLTDLVKASLAGSGIPCPETLLRFGFTAIAFIVGLSGTRTLGILHLFFVIPAIVSLLAFCIQGIGWLALSPESPGFFPTDLSLPSFGEWAKWFFISTYSVYSCETASSFVADSLQPAKTTQFLKFAAWLIPVVFLGGSWVLMQLASQPVGDNLYLNLLTAAKPFWGESASLIVALLISFCCLLSCATTVCNTSRILYQMSVDGHLSPVFSVVSKDGVLGPALLSTFVLSILCLAIGNLSQVVMVTGTGYLISIMGLHLGLWLRRGSPEVLWSRWALGFLLMEIVVLVVGGLAWGWQELVIGLLVPVGILALDWVISHTKLAIFQPQSWIQHYRVRNKIHNEDFVFVQVIVLLILICSSVSISWIFSYSLVKSASQHNLDLLAVLLVTLAFVGVAIACWTTLPQVASINNAREEAENLFINALDAILVVDEKGVIVKTNPAAVVLLKMSSEALVGEHLQSCCSYLVGIPEQWSSRSEQTVFSGTDKPLILEVSVSGNPNHTFQDYIVILRDVTERKQAESLRESEERYALEARGANDGLWDWNLATNEIYFSVRWKAMLGYQENEIATNLNEWFNRVCVEDVEQVRAELSGHLEGLTPHFENEHRLMHKDGTYRWMLSRGQLIRDNTGKPYRFAGSQTDVTGRRTAEHQLLHDTLTGLANRVLFFDKLAHVLSLAKRRQCYNFAVLFIDLDRFKVINDTLGHLVGDQLLNAIAQRLQVCLRVSDTFARLGGDEFAILLEGVQNEDDATYVAERIGLELRSPFNLGGHEVFAAASIGILLGTKGYERPEELLHDADIAMYRAKAQGKGCYEVFDK